MARRRPALERYAGPAATEIPRPPTPVTWRVRHDPPGMLMGGFASLMLQSLHRLAMAGVDNYSDFRTDPVDRLTQDRRLRSWPPPYGSTAVAEAAVERVRRIRPARQRLHRGRPPVQRRGPPHCSPGSTSPRCAVSWPAMRPSAPRRSPRPSVTATTRRPGG